MAQVDFPFIHFLNGCDSNIVSVQSNAPTKRIGPTNLYIWLNYNDLTATSLEIMVNKGNHPKMAFFQVSEIL